MHKIEYTNTALNFLSIYVLKDLMSNNYKVGLVLSPGDEAGTKQINPWIAFLRRRMGEGSGGKTSG